MALSYVRLSDMSPAPLAAPHYRLHTFGRLALLGPNDDTVLGNHGHHRRRLALLAVLAAAGDQGRTRDQLLLLFWPDATQSRARHSLEQLLYALRTSIGESAFAGANPVRLNADVVASDVGAFNAAIERGDLETAVAEYRGPFLEGVHVGDAPEFEQWVEGERSRLARSYADALERLAHHAESARDHAGSARWWRRLAEIDPVSSKYATGLIRALMNAGDHPAALQYAERYEAVVQQELGTSAGPAVAGLVAEVRAEARTEPVAAVKSSIAPTRSSQSDLSTLPAPASDEAASMPVGQTQPTRNPRRRSVALAIGAASTAAVVIATAAWLGATSRETMAGATPVVQSSIAVLPFANVSRDERDAAIVDGLAEELMTALYRIPNLRVIARNSAFAFRNSDLDVRRIGDSLRVNNLVEASVQRSGSRLRVQVRLVDVRDGSTRWAETYEKESEDIFEVQSEIASAVARELNLHLSAGAARTLRRGLTENIAAHELYLKGRSPERMRSPTDSAPREGIALLKQAVALDSNFAGAYAAMTTMYFSLVGHARTAAQAGELRQQAYDAARKALSLDPSLPEAHIGMGVASAMRYEIGTAEAAFRRAIALGGGFRVREHLSRVLTWSGRFDEALAEAIRAAEEDPLSASAAANVGEALCLNGRYEEGLAQLERALTEPPLRRLPSYRLLCYAMQGKWQEARATNTDWRDFGDPWSPLFGYAVARSGDTALAERLRSDAIDRWRATGRGAYDVALVAAGLGDLDEAFEWLDRVGEDLSPTSSIMYPIFKDLHADPRFERYRQRIGLARR